MPSDEPISLTALGSSILGTIIASASAVAPVAAAAAAGASIYSLTQGAPKPPSLPEVPTISTPAATPGPTAAPPTAPDLTKPTPTVAESARAQEAALSLRRRQGRASTILTGPSGLYSSSSTASPLKTLLGQ